MREARRVKWENERKERERADQEYRQKREEERLERAAQRKTAESQERCEIFASASLFAVRRLISALASSLAHMPLVLHFDLHCQLFLAFFLFVLYLCGHHCPPPRHPVSPQ